MAEFPWQDCVLLLRWYPLCFLEYCLIDASTERVGRCCNFCVYSIKFSSQRTLNWKLGNVQLGYPLSLRLFGVFSARSHNLRHLFFSVTKG